MLTEPNPNRSESSDIGYAILDGIDGVCLNTTTSEGLYPDACVSAISRTMTEAEKTVDYKQCFANLKKYGQMKQYGSAQSIAEAAVSAVYNLKVNYIVCVT